MGGTGGVGGISSACPLVAGKSSKSSQLSMVCESADNCGGVDGVTTIFGVLMSTEGWMSQGERSVMKLLWIVMFIEGSVNRESMIKSWVAFGGMSVMEFMRWFSMLIVLMSLSVLIVRLP